MKLLVTRFVAICMVLFVPVFASATPEQDKAFVDAYKKAFESSDAKKLESFLYTKNADPEALDFYKMMMTAEMGSKISKIELLPLTPEDKKKVTGVLPGLDGTPTKLPVTPTKKLAITVQQTAGGGSGTSTSQSYVAEIDGQLMIPVPTPAK